MPILMGARAMDGPEAPAVGRRDAPADRSGAAWQAGTVGTRVRRLLAPWRSQGFITSVRLMALHHARMQVQRAIYEHQNPASCDGAKFVAYAAPDGGVGSVLHALTVALSFAMDQGRILFEYPGNALMMDAACGGKSVTDCYFLPLSKCKPPSGAAADVVFSMHQGHITAHRANAPARFLPLLEKTQIDPKQYYFWWRAQGAAYIVRPNERTKAELAARMAKQAVPPLQRCISLHIRHGDKHNESPVFDDATYLQAVEMVYEQAAGAVDRCIFLSTEDPASVEFFKALKGWKVYATDVPRKPDP